MGDFRKVEDSKRLELVEAGFNSLNISINSVTLGQKFLETQLLNLINQVQSISNSLNDPNQSALGRTLSNEINGYAERFDELLAEQQKDINALKELAAQMKGAFGLLKLIGVSALLSALSAIGLVVYQLLTRTNGVTN